MDFGFLAMVTGALGAASLAGLGIAFLRDPASAFKLSTHHAAQMPRVMAGRYLFLAALAAGALVFGSMALVACIFAGLAALGLFDAWVYASAGQGYAKHLGAGLAGAGVAVLAALEHFKGAVA